MYLLYIVHNNSISSISTSTYYTIVPFFFFFPQPCILLVGSSDSVVLITTPAFKRVPSISCLLRVTMPLPSPFPSHPPLIDSSRCSVVGIIFQDPCKLIAIKLLEPLVSISGFWPYKYKALVHYLSHILV